MQEKEEEEGKQRIEKWYIKEIGWVFLKKKLRGARCNKGGAKFNCPQYIYILGLINGMGQPNKFF